MVRIRHPRDFWAGAMFTAVGVAAIVLGSKYTLGSAARMGPGYFPRMLGILLVVLGGLVALRALAVDGPKVERFRWWPTLLVLGSVVVFGQIVQTVGLALSTVLLIVMASAATREFRWKEALLAGVALATLATGVFIVGLSLTLPIWPRFS